MGQISGEMVMLKGRGGILLGPIFAGGIGGSFHYVLCMHAYYFFRFLKHPTPVSTFPHKNNFKKNGEVRGSNCGKNIRVGITILSHTFEKPKNPSILTAECEFEPKCRPSVFLDSIPFWMIYKNCIITC